MNWRGTWLLVCIAAALLAFIFLYERHLPTNSFNTKSQPLLADFHAHSARSLQLRYGNKFVIDLERTNGAWRYTGLDRKPFSYPAASLKIEGLLQALEDLEPSTYITPREIVARKQTRADFGFDAPAIAITLDAATNSPHALRFGARTPAGDQIYLEVDGKPGIYVVPTTILDRLPHTENDWRDTALFTIPEEKVDRYEIVRVGGGFAVQRDPTNKLWRLTRPAHRADQLGVASLLNELEKARIAAFVTDDARVDLEPFGLQTPEAELTLASGNVVDRVLIGRSPTNDSAHVFARQANATNIVLVSTNILGPLRADFRDLRDRRLVSFAPEAIDTIEVRGEENFVVKKRADGAWTLADAPVDTDFVNMRLVSLSQLQVVKFAMDVVADFTPFALEPPRRQITLRTTTTNGTVVTNAMVTRLDIGTNDTADTVFVRRSDEASVYTVPAIELQRFPSAAWQLRDHRVWNFTTNEVVRVAISENGRTRQIIRNPNGTWAATSGDINPYALEELMFRLGQLPAYAWIARGEVALVQYGFKPGNYKLTIDLKDAATGATRSVSLQFGGLNQWRLPYASTMIDGQPWIFEFPWQLLPDVQRHLSIPQTPPNF